VSILGVINVTLSTASVYMTWNWRVIVHNEMGKGVKETVPVYFIVVYQYFPGGTA
jgi:hypothetical protein